MDTFPVDVLTRTSPRSTRPLAARLATLVGTNSSAAYGGSHKCTVRQRLLAPPAPSAPLPGAMGAGSHVGRGPV